MKIDHLQPEIDSSNTSTMTSTIALFVHQHVLIPLTNPVFFVPAVVTSCIVVLATVFFSNKKTKTPLPPLIKDDFFTFMKVSKGPHRPQYVNRCSRELNSSVFRLPIPQLAPFIVVASPILARIILEGDKSKGIVESEKSHHYAIFKKLFDMAPSFLFSNTDTERWRQGRRGVAPAFSTANIFRQFPSIIKGVNQFHDILSQHAAAGKSVKDLAVWFNKLIFDILGSGMFQVEFNLLTDEATEDVHDFTKELNHCCHEFFKMQVYSLFRKFQWWNPDVRRASAGAKLLMRFGASIIDKYNALPEEERETSSILGHLIRMQVPHERARLADVVALLGAGHETTSNEITWVMVELARHPAVLLKVQQELDVAFPDPSDICDEQKCMKADLTYLTRVINEAMRMNPVITGVFRVLYQDMVHDGMLLPKGSTVLVHFYTMCHSHISQPDEFLPDRWDEAHPEYALLKSLFLPFSLGKRNCVGMNLALLELRIVLSSICRSFTFSLQNKDNFVDSDFFLSLKAVDVNLNISKRV